MALSKDLKTMIGLLDKPEPDTEQVLKLLRKYDTKMDEFYEKCRNSRTPAAIRHKCPCWISDKKYGYIGETRQGCCFSCRLRGGHSGGCDRSDEYGCEDSDDD